MTILAILMFPRPDILTACASRSRWDLLAFYILASDLLSLDLLPNNQIKLHFHPHNQIKLHLDPNDQIKLHLDLNNQIKLLSKDRDSVHPAQGVILHFIFSIFFHCIGFQSKGNLILVCLKSGLF